MVTTRPWLEPLTPFALPRSSRIVPAHRATPTADFEVAWTALLPDRVEALRASGENVSALSHDRSLVELTSAGQAAKPTILDTVRCETCLREWPGRSEPEALLWAQKQALPTQRVKRVASNGAQTAVGYWGGTVDIFDNAGALQATRHFLQDITAITWFGSRWIVGDADGQVMALLGKTVR